MQIAQSFFFLFSSFFPLGSRQGPITIQIQDCSNDPNNNQQWENGGKIQNPGLMTRKGVQLPNIEISNYCDDFEMPPLETMSPFDFMVAYMSSSLLHLSPGSCDWSQAEKKITVVTSWAISQNDHSFHSKFHTPPFWVKTVVILWMYSACNNRYFILC